MSTVNQAGASALHLRNYALQPRPQAIFKVSMAFLVSKEFYRTPSLAIDSLYKPALSGGTFIDYFKKRILDDLYSNGLLKPHFEHLNEVSQFSSSSDPSTRYPIFRADFFVSRRMHQQEIDSISSLWLFGSSEINFHLVK